MRNNSQMRIYLKSKLKKNKKKSTENIIIINESISSNSREIDIEIDKKCYPFKTSIFSKKESNVCKLKNLRKESISCNKPKSVVRKQLNELQPINPIIKHNHNINDILLSIYNDDILNNLLIDTSIEYYSYNKIKQIQVELNNRSRYILIEWIIALHSFFNFNERSLFITINIIDKFLSEKFIPLSHFQLLGTVAFFIASKYDENLAPSSNYLSILTKYVYSQNEILNFESVILKVINFNVASPTQYDLYEFLSKKLKFTNKDYYFGLFILEAFMHDIISTKYLLSDICKCSCYIVCYYNHQDVEYFINDLNRDIFKECLIQIHKLCKNFDKNGFKGILKKFLNEKYMKISQILYGFHI